MGPTHTQAWRVDVERFFDHVADLMLADDPRLQLLGPFDSAMAHLEARAGSVTRSVWNMQWASSVANMRRALSFGAADHLAGLDDRDIFATEALATTPLIRSAWPRCRIGYVPAPLLVTDGEHAFLAGPRGTRHARTIWSTTDPGILDGARQAYTACWEAAQPAQELDLRPRLQGRTLQTALEMALGATDAEIAGTLGVGQRTAAAEVRRVIDWCGARSRGHAVAILVGADR